VQVTGVEKGVAQLAQLHPHTETGAHLLADNGRQWGDKDPAIPDFMLDFIYGAQAGPCACVSQYPRNDLHG
jgi:hypothetical protein